MEMWRPIPSLPEYIASSEGRLMRLPHSQRMPRGGIRICGGQPTLGAWNKVDMRYQISYQNRIYKVARLICEAFHGPAPNNMNCLHIDENSRNNKSDNLKWGTQKENLNAPGFIEYCRGRVGEKSPRAKGRSSNSNTQAAA